MCELLLKNLNNKSVFIFDTETTGLPERVPHTTWGTPGEYWLYSMNDKYDKSRIVSVAWSLSKQFSKLIMSDKIHYYIRQPSKLLKDFTSKHPGCEKSDSRFSDEYNKLVVEAFGGKGDNESEKEDKIIHNIAKIVTIDK